MIKIPEAVSSALKQAVSRELLAEQLARLRELNPDIRVVLANGCFEMLHVGHVRYLKDARSRGDFLVVALNADSGVKSLKGAKRSLIPFEERAELLLSLACVDAVTGFGELTLEKTLRNLRPSIHAKGTDYTEATIPERCVDRELGITIAICGDPKDHSTTELLRELAAREGAATAPANPTDSPE